MNLKSIEENAIVVDLFRDGQLNIVAIRYEEYAYLMDLTNKENKYLGQDVEYVDLYYFHELLPLLEHAAIEQEKLLIEQAECQAFKALNSMYEDDEENYYHG